MDDPSRHCHLRSSSDEVSRRERQTLRGLEIHWAGLTNERPPVLAYLTSLYRTTSLSHLIDRQLSTSPRKQYTPNVPYLYSENLRTSLQLPM
jgi:hypothetical protein